jgi:diguanylate cyclase (GGDEF)-like protein
MKQEMISPVEAVAKRIQPLLDRFYWFIGTIAIPAVIAIFSILALTTWDDLYSSDPQQQLDIRVVPDADGALSPASALTQLQTAKPRQQFETRLVEKPFWFLTDAGPNEQGAVYVEIPSRHLTQLACWNASNMTPMGETSKGGPTGVMMRVKSGHALKVERAADRLLCRATFQGPAKLTAQLWEPQALDVSAQDFHRRSGLLEGGILMLAVFVLITALINRQNLYVIFAAWLVLTLRISTTAGGWDGQWLNHQVPADWLPQMRSFTRALWAILTVVLLKALLRDDLKKVRSAILIRVAEWLCMALLVAAFVLQRDDFILVMWVIGTVALLSATITLVNVVLRTRSMVAGWYCASLTVTLLSNLSEIVAAALGIKQFILVFNTVNGSFVSCLLAALAIAEQMRRDHRERQIAKAKLQQTYDTIPIGMFTLDMQGRFTSINPALQNMLGPRATTQETWTSYFGANVWRQLLNLVQTRGGEIEFSSQMDVTGVEPPRHFLLKAAISGDAIEGSLQDVTEKAAAVEKLNFLADNDALTKVLNRRGIEKAFQDASAQIDKGHPLALAYLDLDRFKLINDLYGHNAGDEVLRQVCNRIEHLLADHMTLGRVGGDEFVILLPDTRMPLATVIARGIIDGIGNHPFRVGEKAFYVRGSIGLIEVSPGAEFEEALSTSDRACREAKTGKHHQGLVLYEKGSPVFKEHQAELRLMGEISSGDALDGLYLEMQPIMSLTRPSDAMNFEVLLRMKDSTGELVPVSRILAAAEDSGRMSRIDHWVLSSTLAWVEEHREQLKRTQFVCVNLSGASLNDEEFMQEVFSTLRRYSQASSFLLIDIDENVALHDLQNTRRFIDKVHSYGARVALDNFGAGYTSFSYLKELPADLLKIDGSFVVKMSENPANASIVEAIVNLARNLGMKTIAEWAEDTATVQALTEIGVDYVQGYAIARPMAPEKLLEVPSAADFIQDTALRQFAKNQDRQNNPLAQLDLLMDGDRPVPPKVH